jgi:hypothetical protein
MEEMVVVERLHAKTIYRTGPMDQLWKTYWTASPEGSRLDREGVPGMPLAGR